MPATKSWLCALLSLLNPALSPSHLIPLRKTIFFSTPSYSLSYSPTLFLSFRFMTFKTPRLLSKLLSSSSSWFIWPLCFPLSKLCLLQSPCQPGPTYTPSSTMPFPLSHQLPLNKYHLCFPTPSYSPPSNPGLPTHPHPQCRPWAPGKGRPRWPWTGTTLHSLFTAFETSSHIQSPFFGCLFILSFLPFS